MRGRRSPLSGNLTYLSDVPTRVPDVPEPSQDKLYATPFNQILKQKDRKSVV